MWNSLPTSISNSPTLATFQKKKKKQQQQQQQQQQKTKNKNEWTIFCFLVHWWAHTYKPNICLFAPF